MSLIDTSQSMYWFGLVWRPLRDGALHKKPWTPGFFYPHRFLRRSFHHNVCAAEYKKASNDTSPECIPKIKRKAASPTRAYANKSR